MRFPVAALLVLVSCNGAAPYGPCTPVNCKGCCDAAGVCNPGTEAMACGLSGGTCVACPGSNTCAAGACVPVSGTAGGSAGGEATAGGAAGSAGGSANGGGSAATAGGSGSTAGGTATAGGVGSAGGTASTAGGGGSSGTAGGGNTGTAGGGSIGTAGGGSGTAGGGSMGTAGGGSGTAGGSGGTAGGSATCGPMSCSNGCCSGGACNAAPIPAACGRNGNFCAACSPGQACTSGQCGNTGDTYAGSPCATNNDCTLGGLTGSCLTGNAWPGGYCQDTCFILSCNGTDVCISNDCWERCPGPRLGQSTCRGGYVCGALSFPDGGSPSYGICRPSCQYAGCPSGTCGSLGYCQ